MKFDEEGHILVAPKEMHELAMFDPQRLIHQVLIPGTPWAFATHDLPCHFIQHFADVLNIHPRNIFLKGSTKIGFSIAPRPNKVWREFSDISDLDLAIVDQHYFDTIDEEVRVWGRDNLITGAVYSRTTARGVNTLVVCAREVSFAAFVILIYPWLRR